MRVALAALLFSEPDLLLLDEPSNHLDLEAALWLESFLKAYRGSLIVVSHERDLLNNVADHILHLERGKLDALSRQLRFLRAPEARARGADRGGARQAGGEGQEAASLCRSLALQGAHRAPGAEPPEGARGDAADRRPRHDASVVFDFPSPKELKPPLIVLDGAAVGYVAGTPVLSRLNLRIDPDDRIALLGRNGNGKTTLARLLAGQLSPMARRLMAARANCGSAISPSIRSRSWLPTRRRCSTWQRLLPDAKPGEVRAQLGRFGFSGDKAIVEVRQLSGGERARLSLALITRDAPHILILDEPTNHLDVDAREALVQALAEFGGAVVVVSHDRHLLGLIADRLVLVDGGTAKDFDGSLDDYRDMVLSAQATAGRGRRRRRTSASAARTSGGSSAEARERNRRCASRPRKPRPR